MTPKKMEKWLKATFIFGAMLLLVVGDLQGIRAQESTSTSTCVGQDCGFGPTDPADLPGCEGGVCSGENNDGAGRNSSPCLEGDWDCDYGRAGLEETSECYGADCYIKDADNEDTEENEFSKLDDIILLRSYVAQFFAPLFGFTNQDSEDDSDCDDELYDCTNQTTAQPTAQSSNSQTILQYEETDMHYWGGRPGGTGVIACPEKRESEIATLGPTDPPAVFRIRRVCLCHKTWDRVQNAWNHINEKVKEVAAAAKGQTASGQSLGTAQPASFDEMNQLLEGFTVRGLVKDVQQNFGLSSGGTILVKAKTPGVIDSESQYCLDGKDIIQLVQAMEPMKKKGQAQLQKAREKWGAE